MFVSPEKGLTFGGSIGPDGSFLVKTGAREGAPAANYQVRIEVEEASLPRAKSQPTRRSARLPFPQKYADEDTSKLTATVKADESNNFEFKLTK
jgi:hypothetical protein